MELKTRFNATDSSARRTPFLQGLSRMWHAFEAGVTRRIDLL